jgi:hypothetical protein
MPDPDILKEFSGYVIVDQNLIIFDLLYFLSNKLNRETQEDIIQACLNFAPYSESLIYNEKLKLFQAIGKKCKDRRSDKQSKDLENDANDGAT